MKPVVVLVGRPNVGKSTLFNALTRSRAAIVADAPGVTRDRQYGDGRVGDRPYLVVDTGGLATTAAPGIAALMSAQTRQAVDEADAIVLVVDGRTGPTGDDREIAQYLRRTGKPVTLAVNKTEGLEGAAAVAEFHALGLGEPAAVAAAHQQGVEPLMRRVLQPLPVIEETVAPVDLPRIAVAGRPNVGKSTLVNALLGEERVVVADQPGTTRDSIRIPLRHGERDYVLIDTAGVRRRARVAEAVEQFSVIKTLQAIGEANVVILVVDARQEVSDQDVDLAGYVLEQGRSLVLAVNKWDGLEESRRDWIKRELDRKLPFLSFAPPHFISALERTGIDSLFPAIDRAFASAQAELPTARLNRVLERAVQTTLPPVARGRRIKLKFAHQSGHNPPRVTIYGNLVALVPQSYRRYLANAFRNAFKLEGTPVRVEFEQGENPYAEKRPKKRLTPRQSAIARRERRLVRKRRGSTK
jgi:GTP-binding protein